jgi:hypothetical protein
MVQPMIGDDGIQGGGRKRQGLGVNDREGQGPTRWPEALAGVGDHAYRGIRCRNGPCRRQPRPILDPEVPRPTAEFYEATSERQPELIKHPSMPTIRIGAEPLMECHPGLEV